MTELDGLVRAAHAIGADSYLVQGGGGNLSLKLAPDDLRIKASGTTFAGLAADGLARVDPRVLQQFYARAAAAPAPDDAQQAAMLLEPAPGAPRPSMETAFHAFLDDAVIHTHPVAVNAIACAEDGERITSMLFGGRAGWVPYQSPGHDLALGLYRRVEAARREGKAVPAMFILQDHGLIVHGEDVASCLEQQQRVLDATRAYLIVRAGAFPAWPITDWEQHGELWLARNPALAPYARDASWAAVLLQNHPFPDSAVFTAGAGFAGTLDEAARSGAKLTVVRGAGIAYRASWARAQEFNDILTASHLVRDLAARLGDVRYLDPAEVRKLRGMDAEKYRQQIKQ